MVVWPNKFGTESVAIDGIDGCRRGKREGGEGQASKHNIQSGRGE